MRSRGNRETGSLFLYGMQADGDENPIHRLPETVYPRAHWMGSVLCLLRRGKIDDTITPVKGRKTMYQYILFDLDGTLTDSKEGIFNCIRYALDTLGVPVPPEQTLLKFIGPPLQDSFMEYCGFDREQAAEAVRIFRSRYSTLGKFENTAAPGMAELCARLKERGYVLALASSKPEEMCVPICEKFGFAPSLAVIAGSPPTGDWEKADVIREAMRRLGLTEQDYPRVLMVGDRKFDVQGAAACGIACVGVEFFGYAASGELHEAGAVAVVRTPEELETYILTH